LALIRVCDVGGHASVDAVANLPEDSEAGEVVGIDTSDLEDAVRAHAYAVAFCFTAAVIDDRDRRRSRRSIVVAHFSDPPDSSRQARRHHARCRTRRAEQIGKLWRAR
jgi:hypothetical protein